ncbi:MAG: hypothetical protein J6U20_04060 [Fibrobacter sp.]|nr:hypothetical protein [Fibrobacter sp.]
MININGFIKRRGIDGHVGLAAMLGTTKKAVDSWSSGDRKPTFDMVEKLLRLGMTAEEIFGDAYLESLRLNASTTAKVVDIPEESKDALRRLYRILDI